jgi:arginase
VIVDLIGVQFDGMGRAEGQARAPQVLRQRGLETVFAPHETLSEADFVPPAPFDDRRGHMGFINEAALLQTIDAVRHRVLRSLQGGRFPMIYGADCAVLLGAIPALKAAEAGAGLLSVDAHEDASPIEEAGGEAANMEIGLLLGLTNVAPHSLGFQSPLLSAQTVALLGTRDEPFRRARNDVATVAERVWLKTSADVAAAPSDAGRDAVDHVRSGTDNWWLHIDLDVLALNEFNACGHANQDPLPGGLTWEQLTTVVTVALGKGGCRGCSAVVYNPDRDSDRRNAARIVEFVRAIAPHLPEN